MQPIRSITQLLVLPTLVMGICGCKEETGKDKQRSTADVLKLSPMTEGGIRALVFVRVDCPISNRYAPEIRRISERHSKNVSWWIVYPNPSLTESDIREHMQEYDYPGNHFHDKQQLLVEHAGATITPEVALYDEENNLVYCGRINDLYVDFGKSRPSPTKHDLNDAITALLAGQSVAPMRQKAVGCYIKDIVTSNAAND